jgi:hypothetical protein
MALGWPIARCDRWIHDGPEMLWDLVADGIEIAAPNVLAHRQMRRWIHDGLELRRGRAADDFE